jgi:hypothetical protein
MPPRSSWRAGSAGILGLGALLLITSLTAPTLGSPAREQRTSASALGSGSGAGAGSTGARPFRKGSYWNTPLGRAPVDPHNRAYIRDAMVRAHTQNYLRLVLGDWGMPVYRSNGGDPAYRINPASGPTVRVHIPKRARSMPTADAALTVMDRATHQVVSLHGAQFHRKSNTWTARGLSRYWSHTNGIARGLPGGSRGNIGHRGIPGSVQAVTRREINRGVIRHRLEIYWWATSPKTPLGRSAYFPMTSSEAGNEGIVPEGIVIRIRRSVNLKSKHLSPAAYTIARALQRYGAVIGDNSGSGNNLKLQANANWKGVLHADSLRSITWRDYVFVKGGYRP